MTTKTEDKKGDAEAKAATADPKAEEAAAAAAAETPAEVAAEEEDSKRYRCRVTWKDKSGDPVHPQGHVGDWKFDDRGTAENLTAAELAAIRDRFGGEHVAVLDAEQ